MGRAKAGVADTLDAKGSVLVKVDTKITRDTTIGLLLLLGGGGPSDPRLESMTWREDDLIAEVFSMWEASTSVVHFLLATRATIVVYMMVESTKTTLVISL